MIPGDGLRQFQESLDEWTKKMFGTVKIASATQCSNAELMTLFVVAFTKRGSLNWRRQAGLIERKVPKRMSEIYDGSLAQMLEDTEKCSNS